MKGEKLEDVFAYLNCRSPEVLVIKNLPANTGDVKDPADP